MRRYLVIGNPIDHSLSPQLHNYWFKKNNINGLYEKEKLSEDNLQNLVAKIKDKKIAGINITVPFKKKIIQHLDELSSEAAKTQSVNTVALKNNKVIGYNTDIAGFESALEFKKYNPNKKKVLILGAGGVVSSLIFALYKMKASSVIVCNRTKSKAENLKNLFDNLKVVNWGEMPEFDMVINATSVGLKSDDELELDFSKGGKGKFFYDVIYNPKETNFLKKGRELGNVTENGKKMFIYQAAESFNIWHGLKPEINEETSFILDL